MVGRVDTEHVSRERGAGQTLGDHGAAGRERVEHVLGQVRMVQSLARCGITDDEERAMAVGQSHVVHRPGFPHPVEESNGWSRS